MLHELNQIMGCVDWRIMGAMTKYTIWRCDSLILLVETVWRIYAVTKGVIVSGICLVPSRRQVIIWNNDCLLLNGPFGMNIGEIWIKLIKNWYTEIYLKISPAKRQLLFSAWFDFDITGLHRNPKSQTYCKYGRHSVRRTCNVLARRGRIVLKKHINTYFISHDSLIFKREMRTSGGYARLIGTVTNYSGIELRTWINNWIYIMLCDVITH